MKQTLAITDITRMAEGRVCIAGYRMDTLECIRLLIRSPGHSPNPPELWLDTANGRIDRFSLIEVELLRHVRDLPHVEDWFIDPDYRQIRSSLAPAKQLELLRATSFPTVEALFETPIHSEMTKRSSHEFPRHNWIIHGTGARSLGTIEPRSGWEMSRSGSDVRILFRDESTRGFNLKVTDLTFQDQVAQDPAWMGQTIRRMGAGQVYLRIGLARDMNSDSKCRLQVTGVFDF